MSDNKTIYHKSVVAEIYFCFMLDNNLFVRRSILKKSKKVLFDMNVNYDIF
jgi:hypothetical protein